MGEMEKQVEYDIEYYKRTGKLPADHDVHQLRGSQFGKKDYWAYVRKNGGHEPLGNAADVLPEAEPVPSNPKREAQLVRFKRWLEEELPKLDEDTRELFNRRWREDMKQEDIAVYFGVTQAAISQRLTSLKAAIWLYVEGK
jgi:RNA polymerase sigma factor (sigma-70 family)